MSDIKSIAETVQRLSPDTLVFCSTQGSYRAHGILQVVLDAVCSVASEEIRMDDWGVDVVMTASQKGLGTPPGLSILLASPKAIKVGVRWKITRGMTN